VFSEPIVRRDVPAVVTKTNYDARVAADDDALVTEPERLILEAVADEVMKMRLADKREVATLRRQVRQLERRLSRLEERGMIIDLPALPAR
jgi:lactate dehydrogenase-like 2-hydroxyacid dehydrogenase